MGHPSLHCFLVETSDLEEATIDGGARVGVVALIVGVEGLLVRMMVTSSSSPHGGIIFGDIHRQNGHMNGLVVGRR